METHQSQHNFPRRISNCQELPLAVVVEYMTCMTTSTFKQGDKLTLFMKSFDLISDQYLFFKALVHVNQDEEVCMCSPMSI